MEIIPAISYFLMFSIALLLIVLAITYLFSLIRQNNDRPKEDVLIENAKKNNNLIKLYSNIDYIPTFNSKTQILNSRNSQIFYLNKGREENKKSFSTQINSIEYFRDNTKSNSEIGRLNSHPRYLIINDTYAAAQNSSFTNEKKQACTRPTNFAS